MAGIDAFMTTQQPTALRPLLGLTVLLVEDSRFACEAVRLMCTRSGARIRRADSLTNARKHLSVYHPSVLIVDVGLPDGSGLALIEALALGSPRIDVIIGTSGDPDMEDQVRKAGADGFIAKPIESLSAFQSAILAHLPKDRQPRGPRPLNDDPIVPDRVAYHDDLCHVADLLSSDDTHSAVDYITQFLGGVARSADDDDMAVAVHELATMRAQGEPLTAGIAAVTSLVQTRLADAGPI